MVKVQIGMILVILGIFAFYTSLIKPPVEEGEKCLLTAVDASTDLSVTAVKQEWDIDTICSKNRFNTENLNSCFQEIKAENKLFPLFFLFPRIRSTYNSILMRHNTVCPDMPVPSYESNFLSFN